MADFVPIAVPDRARSPGHGRTEATAARRDEAAVRVEDSQSDRAHMWSSFGVAGMRQRWASRESDPGRTARSSRADSAEGAMNGNGAGREIKREFMAKPIVIDCAYPGCAGKYLMGEREIEPQAGTGARVVMHCTRNPEEHDSMISVEPFSDEAADRLGSAMSRGEPLHCAHCGTELQVAPAEIEAEVGSEPDCETNHSCSWCGVRWRAPSGVKNAVA